MSIAAGARFSNPAELYDLVHQWKDYRAEAQRLGDILEGLGVAPGGSVLEGACGTAAYLTHLSERFTVGGFDLSPQMLEVARSKLPTVDLFQADLADFSVDSPHDAVVVVFGGLAYVPPDRLDDACACLARATAPGGAIVVEPWVSPERFVPNEPHMAVFDTRWLKVCRQTVTRLEGTRQDGDRAVLDFHWLVARPGFEVEHIVEANALYLYETAVLADALTNAGFQIREEGPGFMDDSTLLVGHRTGP